MNKYLGHLKTIIKHKYYVGIECFRVGLYWQGIIHDLSKFHPTEFLNSAKYWTGTSSPIDMEKRDIGYSEAWLHHAGHNKHHWEYWVDFNDGQILLCPIPDKYILEMSCDIIGASKAYLGDKHTRTAPLAYFRQSHNSTLMLSLNKTRLDRLLWNYSKGFKNKETN